MDFDTSVKLAVYGAFAATGRPPSALEVAHKVGATLPDLKQAYARIAERRLLVLQPDGLTIRMAPPFSGVATQHRVRVGDVGYYANCAWDALGIPAAMKRPGEIRSRCEQSREPFTLNVGLDGPEPSSWLFHVAVPAAKWWADIVFT